MNQRLQELALTLVALLAIGSLPADAEEPLKIFIMTGQSNMQGKASPSTLPAMARDPESSAAR